MDANETVIEVPAEVTKTTLAVERAMLRLIRLLASPDDAVRNGVIAALDSMGVAAIGYLSLGLSMSKDPAYRVRIVEALAMLAPLSRTTVLLALTGAARDKDPEVQKAAARVVWGLKTPREPKPAPTVAGI